MDFRWMDLMFEEVTLVSNTPQLTFAIFLVINSSTSRLPLY